MVRQSVWAFSACLLCSPLMAFESPPETGNATAVAQVLQLELETRNSVDRRELLHQAIEESPDAAPARWQAGFVLDGDEWRVYEEIQPALPDDVRFRYHALRETAGENVEDHLRVANWCKANGLPEQERAHLTAALAFSGERDLPNVRARLGHRHAGGRWMTREEIAEAERSRREMLQSMKTWGDRLQNIAERLAGNRRQRDSAVVDLEEIDDPRALPAIELVLAPVHEPAALQAVEWFARIDRFETSLALARQAAFSEWPSVRAAATEALKPRRWEDFMPALLTAMHRPAESMFRVLIGGRGEVYFTHLCAREMADRWQVARYRIADFSAAAGAGSLFSARLQRRGTPLAVTQFNRSRIDSFRTALDDRHRLESVLARQNERTDRLNDHVGTVLAEITGEPIASDPNAWWDWWVEQIDRGKRPKRVVIVGEDDRIRLPRRSAPVTKYRPPPPPPRPPGPGSCLTAGTLVWTDCGFVPVEQVQIGDRVLSKDVESGELAYKPVVLTTSREAPRIVRLTVAGESLELTGGHLVWASGAGWAKARDLTSGQPLHTVTGTLPVDSVEPVGSGTVYNLVVDDFHTYFFGKARILSHDTTVPKLTNVVVPGLPPESAVSDEP